MLSVTKPKEFASPPTHKSQLHNKTVNETRFAFHNQEISAGTLPSTKIGNIKSIQEDQDQNEPLFNRTWYNIYDSYLHITEETVKVEHINESSNEAISESINSTSNEDIRETELFETKAEVRVKFNDEEEMTYNKVSEEKNQVKSEPVVVTSEGQEVIDYSNVSEIKREGSELMGSEKNLIDESVTKTIKVLQYENTTTDNSCVSDLCDISQTISTRTSDVSSNILVPKENKSLKKLFICDTCNKSFHCKTNLVRHILKHPKSYSCIYCSYKTFRKDCLKGHTNSQHTKRIIFSCSDCNYKAYYKCGLNRHIKSKHTKSTVLNCSYCNYKSYNRDVLKNHINAKHTKITSFSCSYCSHKAHRKWDLDQHINSQHTKRIVFNCSYCSYKSYIRNTLTKHINDKHTMSTSFSCSYCRHKAHRKWDLDQHINSQHTKSIVFNCSYCNYKSYIRDALTKHINAKHTKSASLSCSYCKYKTHRKWTLDQHINSQHTKSTVFNCSYCDYKTYEKGALKKHSKLKHDLST